MVPGQGPALAKAGVGNGIAGNTILEDIDSDLDGSNPSDNDVLYNYDVLNLKDQDTSPFYSPVRDVIEIYYSRLSKEANA